MDYVLNLRFLVVVDYVLNLRFLVVVDYVLNLRFLVVVDYVLNLRFLVVVDYVLNLRFLVRTPHPPGGGRLWRNEAVDEGGTGSCAGKHGGSGLVTGHWPQFFMHEVRRDRSGSEISALNWDCVNR